MDTVHWLGEFPNLIITRTFSRPTAWRCASRLHVGALTSRLMNQRQPFNVTTIGRAAATAAG
jgi:histidinol-phosphate aminotransferase